VPGLFTEAPPELGYVDIEPILGRLGELASTELVLVGGQAVNFWVDYYQRQGRLAALGAGPPLTSKDIDFCAGQSEVRQCALRLNGEYRLAGFDEANTPSVGTVTFLDEKGIKRVIDFIDSPYGLESADVHRTAQSIDILDEHGQATGTGFRVMHPVWCMMSRVCNTMGLPGYDTPHALRQLRASVACAREFLLDLLEDGNLRAVLKLNERIFSFCHWGSAGRMVKMAHEIDPFEAILVDARLPEVFRQVRYPQMVEWLKARRERAVRRR
jgi:hypothetical protein